jgi:L,D-peptidoglycan transpeptidase YkuD (ErfK/YbiS/YcfS/YnhG family)
MNGVEFQPDFRYYRGQYSGCGMDLIVKNPNTALWGKSSFRCAIGKNGFIAADAKREGDGKTPIGRWPIRIVFYRADRVAKPETKLPIRATDINDGWSDDPKDPNYNRLICHPYPASAERLWRDDHIYDYIVALGHNDDPVKPGYGSAIFLHVARETYSPSLGCITLNPQDLLTVLREATPDSYVEILAS